MSETSRRPILLLAGQGFALGLTTAWVLIPASAIFLAAYGADLLPVTYIGAAVAGIASSALLARAFRRRSLPSVAIGILAGTVVTLVASWFLLSFADAEWVAFALLTLVPIIIPVGFIFVVGQAGMLLDVRTLKSSYARVVAGFALGFVAGGLIGPPMLNLLGSTEGVLLAAAVASGLFLALVALTRRQHPAELSVIENTDAAVRPTLRALVRNRYVMLIVAFQMLSAVESQWLDFHVFSTAAQRYETTDALARFISQFSAVAYGTDILFLLVAAGFLLHRFGLRYGLLANAVGVLILVLTVMVGTMLLGSGATVVFVFIVAARVSDLTLADGAVRTSLSAAYQAVPVATRTVAQAAVEGLAVPVAIGVSGVGLLLMEAAGGTDGLILPMATSVVVVAWVVVAVLVYREYGPTLLANLRGRTLDMTDLTIADDDLLAVERLLASADVRDVRLGLDILTSVGHPDLAPKLEGLVRDQRVAVRADAIERMVDVAPTAAVAAARRGLADDDRIVRTISVRALGEVGDASDLAAITAHGADADDEVRVAVASSLTRLGDDAVRTEVLTEVGRLAASTAATDRVVAARMLGAIEPANETHRAVLGNLVADPDPDVATAALAALRWPEDAPLLPMVAKHIDDRHTAGAGVDTLVRFGEPALVAVDDGLTDGRRGRHASLMLVRAGRQIGGTSAVAVLRRHIGHPDREIGLAVMRALATLAPHEPDPPRSTAGTNADELTGPVVRADLEHAAAILYALVALDREPAAALLSDALRDELDLLRHRTLAALSMRQSVEGINRVVFQLAQRDAHLHALALEWLDATLTTNERAAIAILEPAWTDRERLNVLARHFPAPTLTPTEILFDLVHDPDDRWRRPWLRACALYTASGRSEADLDLVTVTVSGAGGDHDGSIVEETLTGLRGRRTGLD